MRSVGRQLLEIRPLGGPRDQRGRVERVDAESAGLPWLGLIRIGPDDLEIARRAERDERVPGPHPRMLAAGNGLDAEERLDSIDARLQIRRRIHEVIDPGQQIAGFVRHRPAGCEQDGESRERGQ